MPTPSTTLTFDYLSSDEAVVDILEQMPSLWWLKVSSLPFLGTENELWFESVFQPHLIPSPQCPDTLRSFTFLYPCFNLVSSRAPENCRDLGRFLIPLLGDRPHSRSSPLHHQNLIPCRFEFPVIIFSINDAFSGNIVPTKKRSCRI